MKICPIVLFPFIAFFPLNTSAQGDRDPQWIQENRAIVERVRSGSYDERDVAKLDNLVRRPIGRKESAGSEASELYRAAKEALISLPGHADTLASKIKDLTEKEVSGTSTAHSSQRGWYFQTLSQLPSSWSVKVLGELLFDERNPFADVPSDSPWVSNSSYAVVALHELGLRNPPVSGKYPDHRNDLRAWQLWFEQVRAGTRTFSFKDDETIYSLAGPVAEAREPTGSPQRRDPREQNANAPAVHGNAKWPTIAAVILAALALLLALRKNRQGRFT